MSAWSAVVSIVIIYIGVVNYISLIIDIHIPVSVDIVSMHRSVIHISLR